MTESASTASFSPSGYPISLVLDPCLENRNRLTVAFRIILAIPQLILVGGPGIGIGAFTIFGSRSGGGNFTNFGSNGVLGAVAGVCAIIAWFAIVFANKHPQGLWDFGRFYMRWHARVTAYVALFRDEYPPFGDGEYAATFEVAYPEQARDRLSVGLRFLYLIPHAIVLFFLNIGWWFTTVVAWFAILFTGSYPAGLYDFGVKVWRWNVRVEAYALLLRDEFPPFSLDA